MSPWFYIPVPAGSNDAFLKEKVSGIPFFLLNAFKLAGDYGRENIHIISNGKDILEQARAQGFRILEKDVPDYRNLSLPGDLNVIVSPYYPFIRPGQFKNLLLLAEKNNEVQILLPGHSSGSVEMNPFTPAVIAGAMASGNLEKSKVHPHFLNALESISVRSTEDIRILKEAGLFIPGKTMPLLPGKIIHPYDIKFLVLDIDGVLTDGGMIFTENGDEIKKFNTKDGLGIKKIREKGIPVAFLSSGIRKGIIQQRADMLGVNYVHVGNNPKMDVLKQWVKELGISLEEVAYVGDDINDLEIFRSAAFCACPSDAVPMIRKVSSVILSLKGGQGCVREFIDAFLNPETC